MVDKYNRPFMEIGGANVCGNCALDLAAEPGELSFCRNGDFLHIMVRFDNDALTTICSNHGLLEAALVSLGYDLRSPGGNTATMRFEPPIIHRLKGRGALEETMEIIRDKLWQIIFF